MRVREVMSSPVVTVPPDMRLKEVADLLVRHGISAVPVVDDGELVGIVSEADLVPLELAPDPRAHLAPLSQPPGGLPGVAGEAMTRAVVALPEDADTAEAGRLMLERRIKSIPVVRGPPGGGHRGQAGPLGGARPQRRGHRPGPGGPAGGRTGRAQPLPDDGP